MSLELTDGVLTIIDRMTVQWNKEEPFLAAEVWMGNKNYLLFEELAKLLQVEPDKKDEDTYRFGLVRITVERL